MDARHQCLETEITVEYTRKTFIPIVHTDDAINYECINECAGKSRLRCSKSNRIQGKQNVCAPCRQFTYINWDCGNNSVGMTSNKLINKVKLLDELIGGACFDSHFSHSSFWPFKQTYLYFVWCCARVGYLCVWLASWLDAVIYTCLNNDNRLSIRLQCCSNIRKYQPFPISITSIFCFGRYFVYSSFLLCFFFSRIYESPII